VFFPRFAESLVTQLACFKLAAAAILPDSDFPAERIRFMIDDAAAAAVLTLAAHTPTVSGSCPVLCYTSGSTGTPEV
jgi:arthrofactin-type cyclic lipopeptide synthetase C